MINNLKSVIGWIDLISEGMNFLTVCFLSRQR